LLDMGMITTATIDIAAAPDVVFSWLVEPAKLTAWLGASTGFPEDPSELGVGYTQTYGMPTASGQRDATFTITAFEPPHTLSSRLVYEGGDQLSTYRLTAHGDGTRIELLADTDWGAMDMAAVEASLAAVPAEQQETVRAQLAQMQAQLAAGAFDESTKVQLQQSLDGSMAKLKQLVEGATAP
jgi:uncharacterized protein YndB with AHSA1/START domain